MYLFRNVEQGTYEIFEAVQSGWLQTFPRSPGSHTVVIAEGTVITGKNFGNYQFGQITGVKFNDLNGNGVKDSNDVGIPNWRLRLFHNSVQVDSTLTNATGSYSFLNLYQGTYVIREQLQAGWIRTVPATADSYAVVITEGLVVTGRNFGNFQLGSIAGIKFNDINGDGVKGQGETALQGWRIRLSVSGNQIDSTLTDTLGSYMFANLQPGTYTVSEQTQSGWIQTFPSGPGTHVVPVTSGLNSTGKNFGNFELGTISGVKFEDKNGNGVKDVGEPLLQGWQIVLSGARVETTTTNISGFYQFTSMGPGTYNVQEILQAMWRRTAPPSPGIHTVVMTSGFHASDKNFGNSQFGIISGTVFNDTLGNGVHDVTDPGLPNWEVQLLQDTTIVASRVTDALGRYSFDSVAVGAYSVREVLQSGWIHTTSETYTFTVTPGEEFLNTNFGNFKLGVISGIKFVDFDGNGSTGFPDSGLVGWKIRLQHNGNLVDSVLTDSVGQYSFSNLIPGLYTVSEEQQAGWTQTYPLNNASHVITMTSGLLAQNRYFGNFQLMSIQGIVFNDQNDNGTRDPEEPLLSNWKVKISGPVSDSTVSDIDGSYMFSNLGPGTYTISEVLQEGWVQNYPVYPFTHIIDVLSGTAVTGKNFANMLPNPFVEFHEDFESGTLGSFVSSDSQWTVQSTVSRGSNALRKAYSDTAFVSSYAVSVSPIDIRGSASPTPSVMRRARPPTSSRVCSAGAGPAFERPEISSRPSASTRVVRTEAMKRINHLIQFKAQSSKFKVESSKFKVQGSKFKVESFVPGCR